MEAGKPFVGRARDLAELRGALDQAVAGSGSLTLVAGEPGIGKTRLAEQVAEEAAPRGALALWSRSWEGMGAPAFWPWIQVLRQLFRLLPLAGAGIARGTAAPDPLASVVDGLGFGFDGEHGIADDGVAAVVHMVPELAGRVPQPAALTRPGSKEIRFRLFDGVAMLLARASEMVPLLLVFDDLHWSDAGSMELLKFVARELHGCACSCSAPTGTCPRPSRTPGMSWPPRWVAPASGSCCAASPGTRSPT
jgi:predicted ATPase